MISRRLNWEIQRYGRPPDQVGTPEMSANPADDYVRQFINSADMTKVLCAKNVMITPCVVRETDSPSMRSAGMKNNGVSTAMWWAAT